MSICLKHGCKGAWALFFLEIAAHLRLLSGKGNELFGLGLFVVISSLTVYTRHPTARGFEACVAGVVTPWVVGT
ncbi:hypothetical protein GCM10009504_45820 [Pseudomonas laurentiana]|nr:hypothetical protein GCM10009504_45820 [Pseudomonas laurentiana]